MTISQQLDLAGGWRDAWRHERRGPHGEWVKGDAVPSELSPDPLWHGGTDPRLARADVSRAIILQWNASNVPAAKEALNRASASWEADDHAETIRQLLIASRETTKSGDKNSGLRANTYRLMAARIRASDEATAELERPVRQEAGKARKAMAKILGHGHDVGVGWNGSVTTWSDDDLAHSGVAGEMGWDGTLGLQEQIATDIDRDVRMKGEPILNPRSWQVLEHEMVHATIPAGTSYDSGEAAYQDKNYAAIEEGFTELGSVQHASEFFKAMGIGDRLTTENGPAGDLTSAVEHYDVNKLYEHQAELRDIFDHAGRIQYGGMDAYNALNDAQHELWSPGQPDGLIMADALSRAYNAAMAPAVMARAPDSRKLGDEIQNFMTEIGIKPVGSRAMTMSELADSRSDPRQIMNTSPWGAYYGQTRAAQQWIQDIAKAEGHADVRPGTPGYARTIELADEINTENPETKATKLAEQAARAIGVKLSRQELNGLAWPITNGWTQAIDDGTSPAVVALHEAKRYKAGHEGDIAAQEALAKA